MTKISNNPIKKTLSQQEINEITEIMSKILNISKPEISESIHLFSNINPDVESCLHKLYKMQKEDYTTAIMLLEYLLIFGKKRTVEIIET